MVDKAALRLIPGDVGGLSVCTVLFLSGFGEKHRTGYSDSAWLEDYGPCAVDFPDFVRRLKGCAEKIDKMYSVRNNAMIVAFATTLQPQAQGWLRQAGFTEFEVRHFNKYSHGISQFSISVEDFCKLIGWDYEREYEHGKKSNMYGVNFDEVFAEPEDTQPIIINSGF